MNEQQLQEARAGAARATTAALHDIADGWRTLDEPAALVFAAKEELERRHPCHDCGAPAGQLCRPEYGCSPKSRRAYTEAETIPAGCTGYLAPVPPHGALMLAHDGPTCPVHEAGPIPPVRDEHPDNDTSDDPDDDGERAYALTVPADWPVQPIAPDDPNAIAPATCGTCGRTWDDGKVTSMTPAPSARCPFEQFHPDETDDDAERSSATIAGDDTAGTPGHNRRAPATLTVELEGAEPAMMIQPALDRGVTVTVKPSGTVGNDITLSGERGAVLDLIAEQWGPDDARTYGWTPAPEPLTLRRAMLEAADACETLAGLDEGEHTDWDRLHAISTMLGDFVESLDHADGWKGFEA